MRSFMRSRKWVVNQFAARERVYKQLLRLYACLKCSSRSQIRSSCLTPLNWDWHDHLHAALRDHADATCVSACPEMVQITNVNLDSTLPSALQRSVESIRFTRCHHRAHGVPVS